MTMSTDEMLQAALLKRLAQKQAAQTGRAAQDAIPAVDRTRPVPMSRAQQRIWFLGQLHPASIRSYHISLAFRLRGPLDRDALRSVLDGIVQRHEALRTVFTETGGTPLQEILGSERGFALVEKDARGLGDAALRELLQQEIGCPIDLGEGPPAHGVLFSLGDQDCVLLLVIHHIVADGWSLGVLLGELSQGYRAMRGRAGELPVRPPLPLQYADYSVWHADRTDAGLQRHLAFWRDALDGVPSLLDLPLDRPRPAVPSYVGDIARVDVDSELCASLKCLAQAQGVTLFMVLLASWAVLLGRVGGQREIVIGTPVANRHRRELEGLIGFFVNTLPLRIDLRGDPTLAEVLQRVKSTVLGSFEHGEVPIDQIVNAVRPERNAAVTPLFQTALALRAKEELELDGLSVQPVDPPRDTTQFDISLSMTLAKNGHLDGMLEYATDLFDRKTIDRLVDTWQALLRSMAAGETTKIGLLALLTDGDHRLFEQWNESEAPSPRACAHTLFEAQVGRTPDATALVCQGSALSYRELNARANQLAHHLVALGVKPDSRVAICADRGLEMVTAVLAVLKAGGAYIPMDPAYPRERLAHMLIDSAPVALLVATDITALRSAVGNALPVLNLREPNAAWHACSATNPDAERLGLTAKHVAYLIYTSGSTGQPKGVMVEHAGLVNLLWTWHHRFGKPSSPAVAASAWTSFSFDVSVFEMLAPLIAGRVLHMVPDDIRSDPHALIEWMWQHRIEEAYFPPFLVHYMKEMPDKVIAQLALRKLLVGVEPFVEADLFRIRSLIPGLTLVNGYGPTETTIFSSAYVELGRHARRAPIGRPCDNTHIRILDDAMQQVPIGASGEICIGGIGVARGYLNQPDLTAQRFVRDPFSTDPDARLYKTGDMGRWLSEGNVEFLGRNDHQVKIRGYRIELGEIEAKLAEHPGVREVVVHPWQTDTGERQLVAYWVACEGAQLSRESLHAHLARALPAQMLPAAYVCLDTLPLSPNGKLDRQALPAPDYSIAQEKDHRAPVSPLEISIQRIWCELLGVARVGLDSNFFDMGGHSLLAARLTSRMRTEVDVDVPLRDVFAYPTLQGLARAVQQRQVGMSLAHLSPIRIGSAGERPLFFVHSGEGEIGYARNLAQGIPEHVPVYGLAAAGFLDGEQPHDTVAQMAAAYISAIRHVQARGPYRLAGWSGGGTIACEMAVQLEALGEAVDFLGLIDTASNYDWLGLKHVAMDRPSEGKTVHDVKDLRAWLTPGVEPQVLGALALALPSRSDAEVLAYCHWNGLISTDITLETFTTHLRVRAAVLRALATHELRAPPCRCWLYVASDEHVERAGDGWHSLLHDRLTVVRVPGDHYGMVRSPLAARLGKSIFRQCATALSETTR